MIDEATLVRHLIVDHEFDETEVDHLGPTGLRARHRDVHMPVCLARKWHAHPPGELA